MAVAWVFLLSRSIRPVYRIAGIPTADIHMKTTTKEKDGVIFAAIGDLGHGQSMDMQQEKNFLSEENNYIGSITSLNAPNEVYAVGIRNTFGLDVDPVTGIIWDTENGRDSFDEVNLVQKMS